MTVMQCLVFERWDQYPNKNSAILLFTDIIISHNKCIRKLLRIPWTKLMITEQVYNMAATESELMSHIKSR